jgi:hypothetical protein
MSLLHEAFKKVNLDELVILNFSDLLYKYIDFVGVENVYKKCIEYSFIKTFFWMVEHSIKMNVKYTITHAICYKQFTILKWLYEQYPKKFEKKYR